MVLPNLVNGPILGLDAERVEQLTQAALDVNPVTGLTHNFYRYPARFSPALVRAAIDTFTEPGDLVLDPFVGGGTTLVEALSAGRHGVGMDISSLAAFVSAVKTTIYTEAELQLIRRWADRVCECIDWRATASTSESYEEAGYLRHLSGRKTWRLRKAIAQAVTSAERLRSKRLELFARCSILRTAQWALDGRKTLPTVDNFRERLHEFVLEMAEGAAELARSAAAYRNISVYCFNRSTSGPLNEAALTQGQKPRLVMTSPPYPGVHVLYHRWQIHGGKETPAPFWIANRLDGDGAAYYTMGDRKTHALGTYFRQMRASMDSVAAVCDENTIMVQVVAFSEPEWQLPRYLSVVDDAGFQEQFLTTDGERLWRNVPNRKWYANQKGRTTGSQEVVLFHRLRRQFPPIELCR